MNTTGAAVTARLYLGATGANAAGTDVIPKARHLEAGGGAAARPAAPAAREHGLMAPPTAAVGRLSLRELVTVKNITTTKVATFAHNSGSSSVRNKFKNIATNAPTPIAPGGFVTYRHDGTDRQLVAHNQDAPVTRTYNSADFICQGR